MIDTISKELILHSDYLNEPVKSIYFGGGTPSLIESNQLSRIWDAIENNYELSSNPEVTLEANPEDLDLSKCCELKDLGINRLSIGVQTFDTSTLSWMNRAHSVEQSNNAFINARNSGFENISIDLIYALPESPNRLWNSDLENALALNPEHISLYGLTIEEKTVFGNRKKKGELSELPEDEAAEQYLSAIKTLKAKGYQQYEVSNFGKPGYHSRHNIAYWSGQKYLGVGPGAHSYNGTSRQFNLRNNANYLKAVNSGNEFFEMEMLSRKQQLNECILTGLRRSEGISFDLIKLEFDVALDLIYKDLILKLQEQGLIILTDSSMYLTSLGFLVADEIALQLFFPD